MKSSSKQNYFLYFVLFLCNHAMVVNAQVKLPNLFGSHMVLQREQQNLVWGTASNGEKITLTIAGQKHETTADKKGDWKIKLNPMQAGGPHTMIIEGKNKIVFDDILIGEVWICTGQSNMAMTLDGGPGQHLEGSNDAILNSTNPNLRFFTVGNSVSDTPMDNCKGNWELSQPKTAAEFSAVGYYFGQRLQQFLNIPIGLISSNVGGTPGQAWTPKEIITSDFPEFKKDWTEKQTTQSASALYNGMIHPLIPFTIKGAIWYQGEGNKSDPEQYSRLFPAMIKSWRDNWKQGDFPFYFVQLAPYGNQGENWVKLQQAQLKTMLTIPNTGMTVINDVGDATRIHPPRKKEVGQRLALWALAKTYVVEGILHSGPIYKSMTIEGNKAQISFDNAPSGITSLGKPLKYFEIAGSDHIFKPAQAKITKAGKILEVWNDKISQPVSVRYAWESYVEGCLFNTASLPASAFCTDDWDTIFKK
ncbi:sialate O-acetylesterase [Flavobacterium ovatum]|uniref:sialate O-acetylesterase n=1 Tax=Flavobacterium ovatum TaxID=1928857 RepID=UPI00344C60B4